MQVRQVLTEFAPTMPGADPNVVNGGLDSFVEVLMPPGVTEQRLFDEYRKFYFLSVCQHFHDARESID